MKHSDTPMTEYVLSAQVSTGRAIPVECLTALVTDEA